MRKNRSNLFYFSTRNHAELFVLYNAAHYFSAHFTLIYKSIKRGEWETWWIWDVRGNLQTECLL